MIKKSKMVKESTLDKMRREAMKAQDYDTVIGLNDIESEIENKLLKARLKGMFGGYGSAMAGFTIGAVIVHSIKTKD